ncbi:MAG: ABC transporter ATP-binding protein/permease [Chloroflexi bacterium]|nr:ABC transporter ATP-binding protein/permease [Chloroflexota bacterium]
MMRRRGGTSDEKAPENTRRSLLRGIGYLNQRRQIALAAYASLLLASLTTLAVPLITRYIIDDGLNPRNPAEGDEALIITLTVLMVVLSIVGGIFTFLQGYLGEKVSQGIAFDLRNNLYEKIQRLSFSYHDKAQTGQLMTRATSDVEIFRNFIGQGFFLLINSILLIVGIVVILFALDWRLTLIMIPLLLLMTGIFAVFGGRMRPIFQAIQERLSVFNTILQENLTGIRVVKAFNREPYERQRFQDANYALMNTSLRSSRVMATLFPTAILVAGISLIVIVWIGGYLAVESDLQLGELTAFTSYLALLFIPIAQLGFIVASASQASASAARIFEILDAHSDIEDKLGAPELGEIQGRVTFEHVTFRYFESSANVLTNVSFEATPGQTVALLGATGSGKSTIINLIPRFYDPTEGIIRIDGTDIRNVTLESLRRQIGIVLQETTLFTGNIRDNISYGRPNATEEEIIAAAQAAAAHDFIMEFPNGYDTDVGERGVTLSGGQKQRIAIARALVLDPRILILDDSTSSVDLTTEAIIQQALDRLMEGRTSFVIAQRISTVLNADQILVLDKAKIIASGTHEELLASNAIYADIYQSQLVEDVTLPAEEAHV